MYRIRADLTGVSPQEAATYALQAEQQSQEIIQLAGLVEDVNSPQSAKDRLTYIEEFVLGGLRNYYSRSHEDDSTLLPRMYDIGCYAVGLSYQEIAATTGREPNQVAASVHESLGLLSRRGLLDIIKNTKGRESAVPLTDFTSAADLRGRPAKQDDALVEADSYGAYLKQIGKTPLLTAAQEVELAKRIEGGLVAEHSLSLYREQLTPTEVEELEWLVQDGHAASEHFYLANLRLVVSIARKIRETGSMTQADITQEGNFGLERAIKKFDYKKGFKFSTYASPWIKQFIGRAFALQADMVRKPVHVTEELRSLAGAERALDRQGIEPTPELLATELSCEVERVKNLLEWRRDTVSLETPIGPGGKRFDENATLLDLLADQSIETMDDHVLQQAQRQELFALINRLDRRSADIISARYGLYGGKVENLKDIGRRHDISGERVRQLERAALKRLQSLAALNEAG